MTYAWSLPVRNVLFAALIALVFGCAGLAAGQSEFLVYSFPYSSHSTPAGCQPQGKLIADSAGNLYGTTEQCGVGAGTVFKLTRPVPPKEQWIETTLYSFTGGVTSSSDGRSPQSALVFDAAGNIYGTALGGTTGFGVVFELSPPAVAGDPWVESILHNFQGGLTDGSLSNSTGIAAGVVFDNAGNLYGVAPFGGSAIQSGLCQGGCGVVYMLTPPASPGGTWTETVLHSFKVRQGAIIPVGTPIFDSKGNLYGATEGDALQSESVPGAVYRLTPPTVAGGSWIFKLLYSFSGTDVPRSNLTFHNKGRLYGTTANGGVYNAGTAFELVPPAVAGGTWTENVLHNFGNGTDGAQPIADVVFDKVGNLYSTTWVGGSGATDFNCESRGCGTLFELSPPTSEGGDWTETILHSFGTPNSRTDGSQPIGGPIVWKNGVLFGTTQLGGKGGVGAVYGVVP